MDIVTPADLGVDASPTFSVLSVEPPPPRKAGIKVKSVEELVDKLRNEAKVIS
jgi:electron transfer flavoprotein beta subunit